LQGSDLEGQFEFVPHTADIAARLRGPTVPALFEAAAAAFAEVLTDRTEVCATAERRVAAPVLGTRYPVPGTRCSVRPSSRSTRKLRTEYRAWLYRVPGTEYRAPSTEYRGLIMVAVPAA
jgi:hypothetical protein